MSWHSFDDALGRVGVLNLARDDRIESHDLLRTHPNICLRRIRLLSAECVPNQKAVELGLPAGDMLDDMSPMEFLDVKRGRHVSLLGSNTDGARNKRSSRG